jgi:hypothetical protein
MRVFRIFFGSSLLLCAFVVTQSFASPQSVTGGTPGGESPHSAASSRNSDIDTPQHGIIILYPYSLSFGRVQLGKTTNAQMVTVRNNGTGPLKISSIAITGDFAQTNNCPTAPATMAVDTDCGIQVTFKPSGSGDHSGVLTVNDDSPGNPHTVALTGAGTLGSPTVKMTPGTLAFSEQPLGGSSQPQTITVTNVGTEPLVISNIEVEGDFVIMPNSTCETLSGNLDPQASCNINVTFTPLQPGTRQGHVVITDNADDSPQQAPLTGTGKEITF